MKKPAYMLLAGMLSVPLFSPWKASAEDKPKAKQTSSKKTKSGGGLEDPKDEFGKAGKAGKDYEKAGKAAGEGGKSLGKKTAEGNVGGGAADFGKGMGKMGKDAGTGTGKVGKSVGRGVGSVFTGGKKESKESKPKPKE